MMITRNNPNISGWSLDGRYTNESAEDNYPYQAVKNEDIYMLEMFLPTNESDTEMICGGFDTGFKLILNTPGDTVDTTQNYIRISSSQRARILIHAKLTLTSDGLRNYTPNQRRCYYNSENSLRFFKIYTESNCKAECLANFTRIECECAKFSMPSIILSSISYIFIC